MIAKAGETHGSRTTLFPYLSFPCRSAKILGAKHHFVNISKISQNGCYTTCVLLKRSLSIASKTKLFQWLVPCNFSLHTSHRRNTNQQDKKLSSAEIIFCSMFWYTGLNVCKHEIEQKLNIGSNDIKCKCLMPGFSNLQACKLEFPGFECMKIAQNNTHCSA